MKKFIKTFSEADKLTLQKAGFTLFCEDDNVATFLNDGKLLFDKKKVSHIQYTDILAV